MRYRTGNNLRAALLALSFGVLVTLAYSQQPDSPARDTSHPTEQGGPDTLGGAIQDPTAAKRGQKLFSATCGFCHGEDAKGRNGPAIVRSTIVLRDVKGNLIGQVIREGRPQKG